MNNKLLIAVEHVCHRRFAQVQSPEIRLIMVEELVYLQVHIKLLLSNFLKKVFSVKDCCLTGDNSENSRRRRLNPQQWGERLHILLWLEKITDK